jgi:hypothetical protein
VTPSPVQRTARPEGRLPANRSQPTADDRHPPAGRRPSLPVNAAQAHDATRKARRAAAQRRQPGRRPRQRSIQLPAGGTGPGGQGGRENLASVLAWAQSGAGVRVCWCVVCERCRGRKWISERLSERSEAEWENAGSGMTGRRQRRWESRVFKKRAWGWTGAQRQGKRVKVSVSYRVAAVRRQGNRRAEQEEDVRGSGARSAGERRRSGSGQEQSGGCPQGSRSTEGRRTGKREGRRARSARGERAKTVCCGAGDERRGRRQAAGNQEGSGEGNGKVRRAKRSGSLWPRSGHPGNKKRPSRGTNSPLGRRAAPTLLLNTRLRPGPNFFQPPTSTASPFRPDTKPHGFGYRRTGQRNRRSWTATTNAWRFAAHTRGRAPRPGSVQYQDHYDENPRDIESQIASGAVELARVSSS